MVGTLRFANPTRGWPPRRSRGRRRRSPHHTRNKSRPAVGRLDFLFQEAVRLLADIAGSCIGPRAALVVGDASSVAGLVALVAFQLERTVIAPGAVDRCFDRPIARLDHAGATHAGDAAIVLHPWRHRILQPAHRTRRRIVWIVEAPGTAATVALAQQRTI